MPNLSQRPNFIFTSTCTGVVKFRHNLGLTEGPGNIRRARVNWIRGEGHVEKQGKDVIRCEIEQIEPDPGGSAQFELTLDAQASDPTRPTS